MLHADFILSIGTFDTAQPFRPANRANIDATCSEHFNWRAGKKAPTDERQQEPAGEPSAADRTRQAERTNKKHRPMRTLTGAPPPCAYARVREEQARQTEKPRTTSGMNGRSHAAAFCYYSRRNMPFSRTHDLMFQATCAFFLQNRNENRQQYRLNGVSAA